MTGLYELSTSDELCAECSVRSALIRCWFTLLDDHLSPNNPEHWPMLAQR